MTRYVVSIHYVDAGGTPSVAEMRFESNEPGVALADATGCANEALTDGSYVPEGSTVVTVSVSPEQYQG